MTDDFLPKQFKPSSKKIFLVKRSFSEKMLQEKILNIIKNFENPYPPDIFTWDNQEKITDSRGKYNKMFFTIVENTKDDIAKALVEEELEHHAKEIELTPALEEKITKEVFKKMYEVHKWAWVPAEWHNNIKPMFMESGVEVAIHEVFQKLKEQTFSLPEKDLDEKEGE